jgi:hypothetical protein
MSYPDVEDRSSVARLHYPRQTGADGRGFAFVILAVMLVIIGAGVFINSCAENRPQEITASSF